MRHAGLVVLAVLIGIAAMLWISAAVGYVYQSRPSAPGGAEFSIAGATLQAVVATAGGFALMAQAVVLGDRATGGTGPWVRRDFVLWAVGLFVVWAAIVALRP